MCGGIVSGRLQVGRLALALILASASAAGAEPGHPGYADPTRFRILFPPLSAEPIAGGALGAANRKAIANIAEVLLSHGDWPGLRFIFVAPRPESCVEAEGCTPNHLRWRRTTNAMGAVLVEIDKAGGLLPFRQARDYLAFPEELPDLPSLEPPGEGFEAIHLFVLVEENASASGSCSGQLLLFDPTLPPVIGAAWGEPALPFPPDREVEATGGSLLTLRRGREPSHHARAFWRHGDGTCSSDDRLASGRAVSLKSGVQTLHLFTAPSLGALGELLRNDPPPRECQPLAALPIPEGRSKGLRDHIRPLKPEDLIRAPRGDTVIACIFPFVLATKGE
jgi:hypothetical protein